MSSHDTGVRLPELLAPAGTMDAFKAALAAGADAIYCGLPSFNARRNADNLTLDDLARACDMAHVAGSRVYVTANILVRDDELPAALALVHDAWLAGADAFIVADWGLIRAVHELWPQVELHLSTQANVADPRGVRMAIEAGCSRVTLARELSLPEIAACCGLGAQIEVFGHGALCVCYSGECLLSSAQRGRSANRGLCRQPCRLPYELLDERGEDAASAGGTRLLSPKDCRTIDDLPALVAAGVGALKVEGRMKAPDYVATVVGAYRAALDGLGERLAQGQAPDADAPLEVAPEVDRALRRAFNRDFTDAYLHGRSGNEMMSYERGNNRGQLVGEVVSTRGRDALVALREPLGEADLLEVRSPARFDDYVTAPSPRKAEAGEELAVRLPRAMPAGSAVRVIRSEEAMRRARAFVAREHPRPRRVDVAVRAFVGEPLRVRFQTVPGDGHPDLPARGAPVTGEAAGPVVEEARTRAVSAEDLREHVGRMGRSAFAPRAWDVEAGEGAGIGFSRVHATRDAALSDLERGLLAPWRARAAGMSAAPYSLAPREVRAGAPDEAPVVCSLVTSPAQASAAREAGAARIYAPAEDLVIGPGSSGRADLAERAAEGEAGWPRDVVAVLGEVGRASDLSLAREAIARTSGAVAAGTVAGLSLARDAGRPVELWGTCELHNARAFEALADAGAGAFWLSPELEMLEISQLAAQVDAPLGLCVSGRARTMTTEHCVLQAAGPCAGRCAGCERRRHAWRLRDEFGRVSLVTSDALGRSRLWEDNPLDATPQTPELLRAGVTRLLVDARLLDLAQTRRAVGRASRALADALAGRAPQPREQRSTSGHLFARIG